MNTVFDFDMLFGPQSLANLPPADDCLISWAEDSLGVKLPESYKQMVKVYNGGWPFLNGILSEEQPFSWHTQRRVYTIRDLNGISRSEPMKSITELTKLAIHEWEGPEGLVALAGEGHWWLCLDYRDCGPEGEPIVIHSENGSESPSGNCEKFVVADSFLDLIKGLRLDYDGDYILGVRDMKREELRNRILTLESKPNTSAHCNSDIHFLTDYRSQFAKQNAEIRLGEINNSFRDKEEINYEKKLLGIEPGEIQIPVCVHLDDAQHLCKQLLEVIGPAARILHCPIDGVQVV